MNLINDNKKIRKFWLSISFIGMVALGVFIQSCSKDDDDDFSTTMSVDSQKANAIAVEYIELIENQYILNLSEKEVLSLGISQSDYARIQKEIFDTNAFILDCQAKGINVGISDPKKPQIDNSKIRLKNGDESGFFVIGQGIERMFQLYNPTGMMEVHIGFTSNCAMAAVHVDISYTTVGKDGKTQQHKESYGESYLNGSGNKKYDIPQEASNIRVTVKHYCSWSALGAFDWWYRKRQ